MDGVDGGEIPEGFKKLQKMAVELGLDKVQLPQFVPSGAPDDLDRMLKEMEDLKEKAVGMHTERTAERRSLAMMEVI